MILRRPTGLKEYSTTLELMRELAREVAQDKRQEEVWFLEHESTYTSGTSGKEDQELFDKSSTVLKTDRGGKITWHGPGQRVIYVMINLKKRKLGPRDYVDMLESWTIHALKTTFEIIGKRRKKMIGVWVANETNDANEINDANETNDANDAKNSFGKIAAIGIRVSRGVAFHGTAINVCPNLDKFNAIIPCGIHEKEGYVTSIKQELPRQHRAFSNLELMKKFDESLIASFEKTFKDSLLEAKNKL